MLKMCVMFQNSIVELGLRYHKGQQVSTCTPKQVSWSYAFYSMNMIKFDHAIPEIIMVNLVTKV